MVQKDAAAGVNASKKNAKFSFLRKSGKSDSRITAASVPFFAVFPISTPTLR